MLQVKKYRMELFAVSKERFGNFYYKWLVTVSTNCFTYGRCAFPMANMGNDYVLGEVNHGAALSLIISIEK